MPIEIVFSAVLKASCVATAVAAPVLLGKYILQKLGVGRRITMLLWVIIGLRLICPVTVNSDFSVFNFIPKEDEIPRVQVTVRVDRLDEEGIVTQREFGAGNGERGNEAPDDLKKAVSVIWLTGMCVMLLCGGVSYVLLKRRLRFAVGLGDNIYTAENIPTSFVMGILTPKIFLSENLSEEDMEYIIIHEQTHIKRGDNITKMIGYVLLAVHWFNPFVWVMFKIFSSDMEYACDEGSLRKIGIENRKKYLNTLINSATERGGKVFLYGVCFSSSPTKKRITNALKFKGCPKILAVMGVAACVMAFLAFGTNGAEKAEEAIEPITKIVGQKMKGQAEIPVVGLEGPIIEGESEIIREEVVVPAEKNEVKGDAVIPEERERVDFWRLETDVTQIEEKLQARGVENADGSVQSGVSYAVGEYSFKNDCSYVVENVKCNESGEVTVCFDLNTESAVEVKIINSETKRSVASFGLVVNKENAYTFSGLDSTKSYDIVIEGRTRGEWMVEGQYFVY